MKIDLLPAAFWATWVVSLVLVSGVFGNHKYIVIALAVIGIAMATKRQIDMRKNSN
jgi:hypothetical protein